MKSNSSNNNKSDKTQLVILSDGNIKLDGGAMFGPVPKALWEQLAPPDRRNRAAFGLNCLLIRNGEHCTLVDTGVGSKEPEKIKDHYGLGSSQLTRQLKNLGISPKEVTGVVLTHLHFDHAGGSTRLDRSGEAVPPYPAATYYIQKAAWEEATHPNERNKASYHSDDFLPIKERGRVRLMDGDTEVAPGVLVKVTDGHTSGHQIVLVNYGGERVAFMGDLVPTLHHLRLPYITSFDRFPEDTLAIKRALLEEAEQSGWLLVFSHGLKERAGYLERRGGDLSFRPVEL